MKRQNSQVSPILFEMIVVTLFLALSAATLVQLVAKASSMAQISGDQNAAMLLLTDVLERTKADPEGDGNFDPNGQRSLSGEQWNLSYQGTVKRSTGAGGFLYEISVTAYQGKKELLSLSTSKYLPDWEVIQ